MALPPTFPVRLTASRILAPQVRELSFSRVDGAPFEFAAGQWVSLILPLAEGEVRRAYSIASAPDQTSGFALAITRVDGGAGSTYLHALPLGSELVAVGPQGFFTREKERGAPALFVATGTGVTPLRSMLVDALAAGEQAPLTLVVGVRHEADMLYKDELDALATKHPNFSVYYTLSRGSDDWTGRRGYVQDHVRALWEALAGTAPPHAFICGLQRMVGTVRDLLRTQMSVPRQQVHSERYD